MESTVQIAFIVAISSILTLIIGNYMTSRNLRLIKREDYARQDKVAADAKAATDELRARQEAVAARLAESTRELKTANDQREANAALVLGKLEDIKFQTDGTLSKMQARLDELLEKNEDLQKLLFTARTSPHQPAVPAAAPVSGAERTAIATERVADATERVAAVNERSAQ